MCKPLKRSIGLPKWCDDGSHDLVDPRAFLSEPEVGMMFGGVCTCLSTALETNNAIVACASGRRVHTL